jgi:subtilisin family serine protease
MGTQKLVLLLLLASTFLVAVPAAPISSQTYIVHLAKNMSHTDIMAKGAWYNEIMRGAKMLLSDTEEDDGMDCVHHVFDKVFNGFSARLTLAQAAYMEKLPGVLKLYPNKMHTVSTTHSPAFLGLTATGAALWNESNYGDGVVIGVIDTGIWPERPSFSDHALGPIPAKWKGVCETGDAFNTTHCNLKIIGARYFLKGNEATYGPINDTNEFRSPRDFIGHGSHCASTAAGRASFPASAHGLAGGTAMGMAPKARIAVYKVLWREGVGATDDIVAAIDQAVLDGVDVISFSIGTADDAFYLDPIAIATYNAVNQGVFVSAAAGNSGPSVATIQNAAPLGYDCGRHNSGSRS